MFEVITDLRQISAHNRKLTRRLTKAFIHSETREITYPSGHMSGKIFFEHDSGFRVRGWSPCKKWPDKHMNFLVMGEPSSTDWLEITVQLNFPAEEYNRNLAGAFVKDEDGEVFLAHRGKLTKGMGALKKNLVLERFPNCITAKDGNQTNQLILIAGLGSPDMIDRLFEFAVEARHVATELGALKLANTGKRTPSERNGKQPPATVADKQTQRAHKLGAYFEEFSGESWGDNYTVSGNRVVEHGAIVNALAVQLQTTGTLQKSQAIDLAVVGEYHVDLYEVKTSANTTNIYTGLGQLILHGEAIADELRFPVRRYLVLPELPPERHAPHIAGKAEIKVITYQKLDTGYQFDGI